jgi:hypothetical protein
MQKVKNIWKARGNLQATEPLAKEKPIIVIEFARLADMCRIIGMESLIAEHIKAIILANSALEDTHFDKWRAPDTNTYCLTS